uniref:type II secretion system minor pseudopilin GspI n=1 Tax=Streptomyces niveiscabiei TaxID=164115 RepID=UPI0038F6D76D
MHSKYQGFTLLEVMVALSICAMAGIAAMQATGEHINHLSSLGEQTYASWVAENVLIEQRTL